MENMERFFKKVTFIFSLITLLFFAGCSSFVSTAEYSAHLKVLTLTATVDDGCVPVFSTPTNRTVMSEAVNKDTLFYYLVSKNIRTGRTTLPSTYITFSDLTDSTKSAQTTLDLPDGIYSLTLYALSADLGASVSLALLEESAVLKGTTTVDLISKEPVKFNLSQKNLSGKSKISLKLCTSSDWNFDSGNFEAYAFVKDETGALAGMLQAVTLGTLPCDTAPAHEQINTDSVKAGIYTFEIDFKNKTTNQVFVYEETILVSPNQDISALIKIPDVIEYAPNAPTELKASYKNPVSPSATVYPVEFKWNDNSNNEKYFEFELFPLPDNVDSNNITSTTTPWTKNYVKSLTGFEDATLIKYDKDFENNVDRRVSGSLFANKEKTASIVINLDLGKRYLARICAVNDAGKSVYSYLDLSAGGTGTAGFTAFAADSHCINRYRMTYNLNGGTLTYSDGTPYATGSIVSYHTQGETVPVLTPSTAPVATITSDTKNFESWTKGGVGGTLFNETSYSGFANLDLYAKYQE